MVYQINKITVIVLYIVDVIIEFVHLTLEFLKFMVSILVPTFRITELITLYSNNVY